MYAIAPALGLAHSFVVNEGGGDEADFASAFALEERRLFGISFSILRDPIQAEDAVQETAVQAWRGWAQRKSDEKTRAWLTTICVRHCIRQRRISLRRLFLDEKARAEVTAADSYAQFDGHLIDLDRAYKNLSRQERAVIVLHYKVGYSVRECGELMGCSQGAAASYLSRALAKLRKELSHD